MRRYIAGIVFLLLLGTLGFVAWLSYLRSLVVTAPAQQIPKLIADFKSDHKSLAELNFVELISSRAADELRDPELALPHFHKYKFTEINLVARAKGSCAPSLLNSKVGPQLQKELKWIHFKCGAIESLPKNFFQTPPFMSASGESFVSMAIKAGYPDAVMDRWKSDHAKFRHALEVLNTENTTLRLAASHLKSINSEERIILTRDVVLFFNENNLPGSSLRYSLYDVNLWSQAIAVRGLRTSTDINSERCLVRDGQVCWERNIEGERQRVFALSSILVFATGLGILILVVFAIQRNRNRREEAAQRLFTLQMLTHELRTPATTLGLALETFRKQFDQLPPESQKAFLQSAEELQRLGRIVEASQNYLSSSDQDNWIVSESYNAVEVVRSVVDRFEGVKLESATDVSTKLKPYWLELIVTNLIQNAVTHGRPPVTVNLDQVGGNLILKVKDEGRPELNSLPAMLKPFSKSNQSKGLGLGLAIVNRIVENIGGELKFEANPTRFIVVLRDDR